MRAAQVLCLFACVLASPVRLAAADQTTGPTVVAQAADEPAPYDAGYAFAASQKCAGVSMLLPLGAEAQANEQFKRGMAMFDHYVSVQSLENACKAALNLYNETTGKAAKLLHAK